MSPSLASRLRGRLLAGLLTAAGALLSAAALVPAARAAASTQDSLTVTITPRDIWPPAPVADLVGLPGAEGQMLLQWTAPDENNDVFATKRPAAGYQIRIATYSIVSVGGSTVTWWNAASDVRALPPPAISATPPTPATPGTTQYLLLNHLWPGVTYYAMIISSDSVGNVSGADLRSLVPGTQAWALAYDAAPSAPAGLKAVQTARTSVTVSWSSSSAYDLDYYKVYFDSTPPYNFSHSSTTLVVAPTTSTTIVGLSSGTCIFKVTAVDRGQPRYPGVALESVSLSSVTLVVVTPIRLAAEPYGIGISTSSSGVKIRWMPVLRYADGQGFTLSTAPTVDELSNYLVERATAPIAATWTQLVSLSSATLTWTDPAGGSSSYYGVRAANSSGLSARSVVRSVATRSAYVVAPDGLSFFEIFARDVAPIEGVASDPTSAYMVHASSHPEDVGTLSGRVLKSLEFQAYRGGSIAALTSDFSTAGTGLLHLRYEKTASGQVKASGLPETAAGTTPSHMSVYWYNGRQWVQLYGTLDTVGQTLAVETKFFGRYELRSVERSGGFSFNQAGVSNRFLTPNGDKKNDNIVFTFDNPRDASVTGKIFDLRGRVVAPSLPPGPFSGNSLVWDGKSDGVPVPGGVYIYQIEAEGQTFTGSIIVVK